MLVLNIHIPEHGLTNIDIIQYIEKLKIPHFRGVFMRDTLPISPHMVECGIMNLNEVAETGSHWVCYYKNCTNRIYFDSFGQITPIEVQKYLKEEWEVKQSTACIKRNTDIVQGESSSVCGQLCLYVLKALALGKKFEEVIAALQ